VVKKSVKVEFNTFVKGIITEASPLNFPEHASFDEENFKLNRNGTRERRLGMDYEDGYVFTSPSMTLSELESSSNNTYEWLNVAGVPGRTFQVVQFSNRLFVYDLSKVPLSVAGYIAEVPIGGLNPNPTTLAITSIDGKLVVVDGSGDIAIISYLEGINFHIDYSRLVVRDVWGVANPVTDADSSVRPSVASNPHSYNLYNQSWGITRRNEGETDVVDPVLLYRDTFGLYPSDNETVWPALQMQPVSPPNVPHERLFINLLKEQTGINVKAAKGYFLIDLLRRGSARASAISANSAKYPELIFKDFAAPSDFTPNGATTVCEFAGRVFYAGFSGAVVGGDSRSPELSNYVAFSQLVRNQNDITKCYQEGDPTSREGSDVVETDGGFFRISGADGISGMVNMGTHLLVFSKNGVWAVSGGSDYGFSATNFKVDKITRFGLLGNQSVVEEVGKVYYWSMDGIYVVAKDQYGTIQATNITEQTIQTLYEDIPTLSKEAVKGVYDISGRTIRWVYNTGTRFTSEFITYELILDVVLKSFYRNKITKTSSTLDPEVFGVFRSTPFQEDSEFEEMMVGDEPVYVGAEPVSYITQRAVEGLQSTRYLIIRPVGTGFQFTFGHYRDTQFRDWYSHNNVGVDAKGYLVTGAITAGDSSVDKQAPYLVMHFKRTELGIDGNFLPLGVSGCLVRCQWGFTNSAASNKWGPLFQTYRYRQAYIPTSISDTYDTGYELVTSKSKLRGRGKALSIYMETEPTKDCQIVGWSLSLNGNSVA